MPSRYEAARAELLALLAATGGTIRPDAVVAFAENPETALHRYFQWDDSEAAHRWRVHQARLLIKRVTVVVEHPETHESLRFRVAHSLPSDRLAGVGYRSTVDVMNNPALREELVASARRDLAAFRVRYKGLAELPGLFDALGAVERALSPISAAA